MELVQSLVILNSECVTHFELIWTWILIVLLKLGEEICRSDRSGLRMIVGVVWCVLCSWCCGGVCVVGFFRVGDVHELNSIGDQHGSVYFSLELNLT
jgi:hypothetical protein